MNSQELIKREVVRFADVLHRILMNDFRPVQTFSLVELEVMTALEKGILRCVEHLISKNREILKDAGFQLKNVNIESYIEKIFFSAMNDEFDLIKVRIIPQYRIGKYRADFALFYKNKQLVVECDGHEFHEKTPRQVTRDKQRDRFMQSEGFTVYRFTGSEIVKKLDSCIYEISKYFDIDNTDYIEK